MWEIIVDKNKCSGDEECVNACPAQVFEMQDGKGWAYLVFRESRELVRTCYMRERHC